MFSCVTLSTVMAGLVPAIHALLVATDFKESVDARPKAGHDDGEGGASFGKPNYSSPSTILTSRSAPLPSAASASLYPLLS
jgi:hypothetical protein